MFVVINVPATIISREALPGLPGMETAARQWRAAVSISIDETNPGFLHLRIILPGLSPPAAKLRDENGKI